MGTVLSHLKKLLQMVSQSLSPTDGSRITAEIHHCLQLVHSCRQDLDHLISLRNEHLELLENTNHNSNNYAILSRINQVIDSANQGLFSAGAIMEKYRPRTCQDKIPLHRQISWKITSSGQFRRQEPSIIRQNAAVLAELTYLRQLTMTATMDDGASRVSWVQRDTPSPGVRSQTSPPTSWSPMPPARSTLKLRECYELPNNVAVPAPGEDDLPEVVPPNRLPGPDVNAMTSVDFLGSPDLSLLLRRPLSDNGSSQRVISVYDDGGLSKLFGGSS